MLTRCFLHRTLAPIPADGPYVAVVDGVQLRRSSQRMPGPSWLKCPRTPPWKPGIHRARRFVHLAALLPRWQGDNRTLPLHWVPAFPPTAVPGPPHTEGEAARVELCWLRTDLDAAGQAAQPILALGNGSYDVVYLWATPERTVLLRMLISSPPRDTGSFSSVAATTFITGASKGWPPGGAVAWRALSARRPAARARP